MAAGIAALYCAAAVAGIASGGELDPPGAPAETMKSLDDIPGAWHRMLDSGGSDPCDTPRFDCVLNNVAVLDRETGLVWQRDGSLEVSTWIIAGCQGTTIGPRRGWRLPTVDELLSLAVPYSPDPRDLPPANSPFTGFDGDGTQRYWTTTEYTGDASFAWVVDPVDGYAYTHPKAGSTSHTERVVCVRGR